MAVWLDSHSTFNEQVDFSGNSAGYFGGGMIVLWYSHSIFNEQVEFFSNSAGNFGGGMAVKLILIVHSINKLHSLEIVLFVLVNGGMAVSDISNSTFNEQVEFSGNSAGRDDGGGIAVLHNSSNSTFNEASCVLWQQC